MWILARTQAEAFRYFEDLSRVRIHANYRKLPYRLGYGLRMGTNYAALAGVDTTQVRELSSVIAQTCMDGFSLRQRHRVRELAAQASRNALLPVTTRGEVH